MRCNYDQDLFYILCIILKEKTYYNNVNLKIPKQPHKYNKDKNYKSVHISIFHQNIQHLRSRIDGLSLTLEELGPSVKH